MNLVHNALVTFKSVAVWFIQVVPIASAVGFGASKLSKDRSETNLQNYAVLEPHYEELKSALERGYSGYLLYKDYLIAKIGSTDSLDPMMRENLTYQIDNAPHENSMLDYKVSKYLPKKCQSLASEWLSTQDESIDLILEIASHYETHTRYIETFEGQKNQLIDMQLQNLHKRKAVEDFIEKDKLHLTKSTRKRGWFSW